MRERQEETKRRLQIKSGAMLADISMLLAGTLACQVVGFNLEPLGFAEKKLSGLKGPRGWLQPRSHCLGCGRRETLNEWRENKRKTERRRKQRRRPDGEQQVFPGSRANM